MKKLYPFLLLSVIFLFGCKEDNTPAWVVIDSIELTTNEAVQGVNSHSIDDAWVYMDNTALGVFDLPAKIPVLAEGTHKFIIYGGVRVNGINATRTRYPFYERYEVTVDLVKGQEVTINPVVTYKSNTSFAMIEDFEDVGIDFVPNSESDTNIQIIPKSSFPDIVKYGNACGGIFFVNNDTIYKGATQKEMDLPKGGSQVFMEIDYYNTNSLAMGVIAQNSGGVNEHTPLVIMNPQTEGVVRWKKLYIELTEDVSYEINAASYEIYLLGIRDPDLSGSYIYVDNIKVVHFL